MADKFWMVWNPNGNSPRVRHLSRESARREALRLNANSVDDTFFVLEAVEKIAPRVAPAQITDLSTGQEIPQPGQEVRWMASNCWKRNDPDAKMPF